MGKPVDYLTITKVLLSAAHISHKLPTASGQAHLAPTNGLGEHGGMGFGSMWQKCKVPMMLPNLLAAIFVSVPDAQKEKWA